MKKKLLIDNTYASNDNNIVFKVFNMSSSCFFFQLYDIGNLAQNFSQSCRIFFEWIIGFKGWRLILSRKKYHQFVRFFLNIRILISFKMILKVWKKKKVWKVDTSIHVVYHGPFHITLCSDKNKSYKKQAIHNIFFFITCSTVQTSN